MDTNKLSENIKNLSKLYQLNIVSILNAWYQNRKDISNYLQNISKNVTNNKKILGFTLDFFVIVATIIIVSFISASYLLLTEWDNIPKYIKYISIVLLPFMPLLSVIIIQSSFSSEEEQDSTETNQNKLSEIKELSDIRKNDLQPLKLNFWKNK